MLKSLHTKSTSYLPVIWYITGASTCRYKVQVVKFNTGLWVMMGAKQSLQSIGKLRELLHTHSFYTSVRKFRAVGRHLEVGHPKACCLSGVVLRCSRLVLTAPQVWTIQCHLCYLNGQIGSRNTSALQKVGQLRMQVSVCIIYL